MSKRIFEVLAFLICIAVFVKCDNYEFPKSPYPVIQTLSVVNVSETGVTFQATITRLADKPIINHGFEWDFDYDNLSIQSEGKIELGKFENLGDFEAAINTSLYDGKRYYVRAFIVTDSYRAYGNIVSFTSKGGTPPKIDSFSPVEGTWGDTITIKGERFSAIAKYNLVKFGSFESRIISSTDSTIQCIVPEDIPNKTVLINLVAFGESAQSSIPFTLASPVIEGFSPAVATFENIITITGKNFSSIKANNLVKFNEHTAQIMESSDTQLKVKVPLVLKKKENVISVTVKLQTTNAGNPFLVAPPLISSVPDKGYIGGTIAIEGSNFHPSISENKVFIGGQPATILDCFNFRLYVQIPQRVVINRNSPIEVEVIVAEQSAIKQRSFTILNPWIKKPNIPSGSARADAVAFSINGMGYVGLGSGGAGNRFWQYNPVENSWTEIAPFPGGARIGATCFVIDDKAYVGLGKDAPNDFWRYDPDGDSWTQVADFPYSMYKAVGLSLNGNGYVVTKAYSHHSEDTDETTDFENFWRYDPISDSWTSLGLFFNDGDYTPGAGFVIDDRLFIYMTFTTPYYPYNNNSLAEFDFTNNEWMDKGGLVTESHMTGFVLGDFGYLVGATYLYKYFPGSSPDSGSDFWLRDPNEVPGVRSLSFAFVIDGKVYFGGGTGYNDLWEFDPAYE